MKNRERMSVGVTKEQGPDKSKRNFHLAVSLKVLYNEYRQHKEKFR